MGRESQRSSEPSDWVLIRAVSFLDSVYRSYPDGVSPDGKAGKKSWLNALGQVIHSGFWLRPFTTIETLFPVLVSDFMQGEALTQTARTVNYLKRQKELAEKLISADPAGLAYTMMGYYRKLNIFGKVIGIEPDPRIAIWTSFLTTRRRDFGKEFEKTLYRLFNDSVSGDEEKKRDAANGLVYWLTIKNPDLALEAVAKFGTKEQHARIKTFLPDEQKNHFEKAVKKHTTADTDVLAIRNEVSQYIENLGLIELIIFHYLEKATITKRKEYNDYQHQLTMEQIALIGSVCPAAASLILFFGRNLIKDPDSETLAELLLLPNISNEPNSSNLAYAILYEYVSLHPEKWRSVLEKLDSYLNQNDVYKGKRIIPGPVKDFLKMAAKSEYGKASRLRAFKIMVKIIRTLVEEIFGRQSSSNLANRTEFNFLSSAGGVFDTIFRFIIDNPTIHPPFVRGALTKIAVYTTQLTYNFIKQLNRVPPQSQFREQLSYNHINSAPTTHELALFYLLKAIDWFICYFGDKADSIKATISIIDENGNLKKIEIPLTYLPHIYDSKISELQRNTGPHLNLSN